MLIIGIDPGVKTGVAVYDSKDRKFLALKTCGFWEALDFVRPYILHDKVGFVVEDPRQNASLYERYKYQLAKGGGDFLRKILKTAQDVGGNKRSGQLLVEYFRKRKLPLVTVRPKKGSTAKHIDKDHFHKMIGWKGNSSEHARDAAYLVWGRTAAIFNQHKPKTR